MSTEPGATASLQRNQSVRELSWYTRTHDSTLWTDTHGVGVTVSGDAIRLTGRVRSWDERESAEVAARQRQGITHVENLITVVPDPE